MKIMQVGPFALKNPQIKKTRRALLRRMFCFIGSARFFARYEFKKNLVSL